MKGGGACFRGLDRAPLREVRTAQSLDVAFSSIPIGR